MRVRLTAITFGVVMGLVFLTSLLEGATEDGLTIRRWIAIVMISAAGGILMAVLYLLINRHVLRKRGLSMHDDEDFED
jgi:hypothetical protein